MIETEQNTHKFLFLSFVSFLMTSFFPDIVDKRVFVGEKNSRLIARPAEFHEDVEEPMSATPLFDTNRDETYDRPELDINRDETYDTPLIDINPDETYNTPLIDVNRDETYDTPLIDINGDETYDTPLIDANPVEPVEPYDTLYLAPNSSMLVNILLPKKLRFLDMASGAMCKNLSFLESMLGKGDSYMYRDYTDLAAEEEETRLNAELEAFETREEEISNVNSDKLKPELQATAKQLSTEEPIVFSSEKQNDHKEKESAVLEKPNTVTSIQFPTYKPTAQLEENVEAASDINLTKRARFRCFISRLAYFKMVGRIVCGYHLPRIYVSG